MDGRINERLQLNNLEAIIFSDNVQVLDEQLSKVMSNVQLGQ